MSDGVNVPVVQKSFVSNHVTPEEIEARGRARVALAEWVAIVQGTSRGVDAIVVGAMNALGKSIDPTPVSM